LLLQSAQLGADRRRIGPDRCHCFGRGEVVGPIRRQIPNVFTGPHFVTILQKTNVNHYIPKYSSRKYITILSKVNNNVQIGKNWAD
jgi:hypothetical protein